jgi:hypothetical protein
LEQGGVGHLTWTLASGSLPPGLSLSPNGIFVGTPTASGAFTFAVHLVDSSNPQKAVTSGSLMMNVVPQPATALAVSGGGNGTAILSWVDSSSGDIAGYKVYQGTTSGNYTTVTSVNDPAATGLVVSGLTSGPYFYVVTAVSTSGAESARSNEVSIVIP